MNNNIDQERKYCDFHEAEQNEPLPYVFDCPACDQTHVAIRLERLQIEWLAEHLSDYSKTQKYALRDEKSKPVREVDKRYCEYLNDEIDISKHVLEDVVGGVKKLRTSMMVLPTKEKRKAR